jgi:hypothetical protein
MHGRQRASVMASRRLGHRLGQLGQLLDDQLARRSITDAVKQIDGARLGACPLQFAWSPPAAVRWVFAGSTSAVALVSIASLDMPAEQCPLLLPTQQGSHRGIARWLSNARASTWCEMERCEMKSRGIAWRRMGIAVPPVGVTAHPGASTHLRSAAWAQLLAGCSCREDIPAANALQLRQVSKLHAPVELVDKTCPRRGEL